MNRRRILISGALANKPFNGGNAWSRLSWIIGFKRLGFDVLFVEQIARDACVDAKGAATDFAKSVNLAYFDAVMKQFGLADSSALICDDGRTQVFGQTLAQLTARAKKAELLFNLSGHLQLPELKNAAACKAYYDDDPGFTQFWHAAGGAGARLEGHDFFFTLGANIGASDCVIPGGGVVWRHTRPPVVLEQWPEVGKLETGRPAERKLDGFTTVASWRGAYGPVQYGDKTYGQKAHEFRRFFDLPRRSGHSFEIALQIHPADQRDHAALRAHGWRIADPRRAAGWPDEFRRYVQSSSAEFSAAQAVYVETNSGWFSDRTIRYLASGKPALVQETGFSQSIPNGGGLVSFRTMDEAVEGAGRIARDYKKHCRAARRLAEEYFDSDKVVGRLLQEIGLARP